MKAELRQYVPVILIVLLVIAIMALATSTRGGEILLKIKNIFPEFGSSANLTEKNIILRYSIEEDKLEWHDGFTFQNFNLKELKIGEKIYEEEKVKEDLSYRYYFNDGLINPSPIIINKHSDFWKGLLAENYLKHKITDVTRKYSLKESSTNGKREIHLNDAYTEIFFITPVASNQIIIYSEISPNSPIGSVQNGKIIFTSVASQTNPRILETINSLHQKEYLDLIEQKIHPELEVNTIFCAEFGKEIAWDGGNNKETAVILRKYENSECAKNGNYGTFLSRISPHETHFYEASSPNIISSRSIQINNAFPEISAEILKITKQWRDQVLRVPVTIRYKDGNGREFSEKLCPRKIDEYLVIELNKPTSAQQC